MKTKEQIVEKLAIKVANRYFEGDWFPMRNIDVDLIGDIFDVDPQDIFNEIEAMSNAMITKEMESNDESY